MTINEITILGSIVVSISDCHSGDRGSIPRRGGWVFFPLALFFFFLHFKYCFQIWVITDMLKKIDRKNPRKYIYQKRFRKKDKNILPGGESNPGLPRDRRGYLPLYYRGHGYAASRMSQICLNQEERQNALHYIKKKRETERGKVMIRMSHLETTRGRSLCFLLMLCLFFHNIVFVPFEMDVLSRWMEYVTSYC